MTRTERWNQLRNKTGTKLRELVSQMFGIPKRDLLDPPGRLIEMILDYEFVNESDGLPADFSFDERDKAAKLAEKRSKESDDRVVYLVSNGWNVAFKDKPLYLYPAGSIWYRDGVAMRF